MHISLQLKNKHQKCVCFLQLSYVKPQVGKCTLTKHQSLLDKCDPAGISITVFWVAK